MLPVTNAFRESIYAAERQILARATIHMTAFGEQAPLPIEGLTTNLQGKVVGSSAENSNLYKTASNQYLLGPTNAAWVEGSNTNYANVGSLNAVTDDKANAAVGQRGLQLFGFNVLDMLEREFGEQIWQGVTTVAEKRDLALSYIDDITLNWHGNGLKPSPTFAGFRYIRDWTNGSNINPSNHWLEVQCLAGATNRCAGKTPTSNKTLTNPLYATDGNTTGTYAADGSATGAAYVQIDLGALYSDIDTVKVWHYYADGRTYSGTKTEVSVDGVTWTTLRDSAVSGTYPETSTGLILKPQTKVNYCGLASWKQTAAAFDYWNSHTSNLISKLTNTWTDPNLVIDDTGFFWAQAYSEISNVSGNTSIIKTDYVELILNGAIRITTRVYDNDKIIRFNILEEINVLNETLPSNEASITLDNADGEFNILTYGNMYDVLASRPTVFIETGLVCPTPVTSSLVNSDFEDFPLATIATSWTLYGSGVTLSKDTGFTGNGQKIDVAAGSYGGVNSGYELVNVPVGAKIYLRFLYKGAKPNYNYLMNASGNKAIGTLTVTPLDDTWFIAKAEIDTTWTTVGNVGIILCLDQRTGVAATTTIDDVYMSLSPYGSVDTSLVEWIPCGKYFVTEWKNDLANRIITFTCHDYFYMLGDTSYGPTAATVASDLYSLTADVLAAGEVEDFIIDSKLSAITAGKFFERVDCRTALQNIAIAAQVCIFQDRYGRVVLKPFATLDKLSNFLLYTRNPAATPSQLSVNGNYAGPNTYSVISTGSGMRFIDYDSMYSDPEISLSPNISQLIIKVFYSVTDAESGEVTWESRDTIHTSPHITGNTGVAFTIENPLVLTDNMANEIADWYFDESLYNAQFRAVWRQNTAIECTDMVLIEDPFHSNKQTRVFRQEFNYEGYLEGSTESRGGV